MSDLIDRYQSVRDQIRACAQKHGRPVEDISLVAVSKRHDPGRVIELARHGHRDFAENYLQEALEKIAETAQALGPDTPLSWHFIGHIQSRKSREIAEHFDWVHTVSSEKVARKLNQHRDPARPLDCLIQLNLQDEETKSGIGREELPALAALFGELPNLRLRGLMIIPRPEPTFEAQRAVFRECRELLESLNREHDYGLDTLSMGMTDDMEAAIAEGATQIRIGTAIFGPRPD